MEAKLELLWEDLRQDVSLRRGVRRRRRMKRRDGRLVRAREGVETGCFDLKKVLKVSRSEIRKRNVS